MHTVNFQSNYASATLTVFVSSQSIRSLLGVFAVEEFENCFSLEVIWKAIALALDERVEAILPKGDRNSEASIENC
ncbi:hypothetical protein SD81_006825 [Tolypothrix campylonemoides VB511288]|nr:hypothetical protein SD81_006825 [Tolypothrix campylonemoides VB511288]